MDSQAHPFAKEHDWEASRYAGYFVYWPTLIARWGWLELMLGHFGAGWRIFAVFLLMAGLLDEKLLQLTLPQLGAARGRRVPARCLGTRKYRSAIEALAEEKAAGSRFYLVSCVIEDSPW